MAMPTLMEQGQAAYEAHMDALAERISRSVEGETINDMVFACCAVVACATNELPDGDRQELQRRALHFMKRLMDRKPTLFDA
jgi:hypothetical protein